MWSAECASSSHCSPAAAAALQPEPALSTSRAALAAPPTTAVTATATTARARRSSRAAWRGGITTRPCSRCWSRPICASGGSRSAPAHWRSCSRWWRSRQEPAPQPPSPRTTTGTRRRATSTTPTACWRHSTAWTCASATARAATSPCSVATFIGAARFSSCCIARTRWRCRRPWRRPVSWWPGSPRRAPCPPASPRCWRGPFSSDGVRMCSRSVWLPSHVPTGTQVPSETMCASRERFTASPNHILIRSLFRWLFNEHRLRAARLLNT
mmetsp:Transcript_7225/g.22168  ORF Transcript_7225/g.22168 Transcript_7225/m.22168 type:complete len:269 (+) Transcript_7225:2739-3545(+)